MAENPTIDRFRRDTARRLRYSETAAETKLWRALKRIDVRGTHFRRQMPIGRFVVDFACPAARLIIEVDGSQHGEGSARLRDARRTAWLEAQGYRVLRFWNNDVLQNIEAVLEAIYAELYGSAHAAPRTFKHKRHARDDG